MWSEPERTGDMKMELRGRSALITGAAGGIGRALAMGLAREGVDPLVLCDIDPDGLQVTADLVMGLGRDTLGILADVSDLEAVEEMVGAAVEYAGRIDVLVNAAGVGVVGPIEVLSDDDWRWVLGVNLFGTINTVRCLYPGMMDRGSGLIVNIASGGGLFTFNPYVGPYGTSKFGVVGFSEALLLEAHGRGVGVTCVCPGVVRTAIFENTPVRGFRAEMKDESVRSLLASSQSADECAAEMIAAIRKGKFLCVTTPSARRVYFLKRHFPFAWYALVKGVARRTPRHVEKYRL
jgi:NAD(P)-dependent dehydrogenase (short-subunit alcohol dehydrogenase family)